MADNKEKKNGTAASELPDTTGWVVDSGGEFPPYWNPEIGQKIFVRPLARDERDPKFHRYVLQALMTIPCAKGPSKEQESVTVKKGEKFTCSAYGALHLEDYMGLDVVIDVQPMRKAKETGYEYWDFKVIVSPETSKILAAKRAEIAKALPAELQ